MHEGLPLAVDNSLHIFETEANQLTGFLCDVPRTMSAALASEM